MGPGTVASALALVLYRWIAPQSMGIQFLLLAVVTVLGAYAIEKVQRMEGIEDDGRFVIDEVVGMWISVWGFDFEWTWMILGFLLFRFYDIVKPYPAHWIDEKLRGGWGVMADDIVAGIYALCSLHLIYSLQVFL
ncbi:MAG: phosphatidylglycerophosphatase A [Bdellovibrionota bacterium]